MPNTYRSNIDFINFLPKRQDWQLNIRDGLFSFGGAFLLEIRVNWLLGLRVAILRLLKPEFVAVRIYVESEEETIIAVSHLRSIPNLKGLWIYGTEGKFLRGDWELLTDIEYLFLQSSQGEYHPSFFAGFDKNKNIKNLSFGYPFDLSHRKPEQENEKKKRLKFIKGTKGKNLIICFPYAKDVISNELKTLQEMYHVVIASGRNFGFNSKFKILLRCNEHNNLHWSDYPVSFQTHITESELKEWIFELLNFKKINLEENDNFDTLYDFFYSKKEVNILIALNILKHSDKITKSMLYLVFIVYQNFIKKNKEKNETTVEIIELAEEILLTYIPSPVIAHLKKAMFYRITPESLLTFFGNFDSNEYQIHKYLMHEKGSCELNFFINLDEEEKLPKVINTLNSTTTTQIRIKFKGKGNIIPIVNKIIKNFNNIKSLLLSSQDKGGLDLGYSTGEMRFSGETLSFSNFYCKEQAPILCNKVIKLQWTGGGNIMRELGSCFPNLQRLLIFKSKCENINFSSLKNTLEELYLSETHLAKNFNTNICQLTNLKILKLMQCGIKTIPEEILSLQKIEEIHLHRNVIALFPNFLKSLKKLRILNLSGNQIKMLPFKLQVPSLQSLNLSHNKIKNFAPLIDVANNIKKVDLSNNNTSELTIAFINGILEIKVPPTSCKAGFRLLKSNYTKETIDSYTKNYPKVFSFRI